MRTYLLVFIAISMISGIVWLAFNDFSIKPKPKHILRTIQEQEELRYREPFNVAYQLEMAAVQYQLWEESMKTDQETASKFLTAYMVAYYESGESSDINKKFEPRYRRVIQTGSLPNVPLDIVYTDFKPLYLKMTPPNLQRIVEIRSLFESIWQLIDTDMAHYPEAKSARSAVEKYLWTLYHLVIGNIRLQNQETGELVILGNGFYKKWEEGMRAYGLVLLSDNEFNYFKIKETLDTPIPWGSFPQIGYGEHEGRFRLPSGDEVVPGVRYFEDIADTTYSPRISEPDSPANVYRHFRQLQTQSRWSEMYDMLDVPSQKKMAEQARILLHSMVTDEQMRRKIDLLDDRDLYAIISQGSISLPVEVLSEKVDGNIATVTVSTLRNNTQVISDVQLVRIDDRWRIVFGAAPSAH